MYSPSFTIAALLVSSVAAKVCHNITIPLNITGRTAIFDIPTLISNSDATTFIQNLTRTGQNFSEIALTGYQNTAKTYKISTQFCAPSETLSEQPTIQILTHGLGFDKSYWDLPYNDFNYSYVDVATDKYKYCTLSYDRLGVGNSTHGDPINEVQTPLEVAILAELTGLVREGKYPAAMHPFQKVTHVGHSFGSVLTYALVASIPTISDGIVLTGFSLSSAFQTSFLVGSNLVQANLNQPFRFGNLSDCAAEAVAKQLKQPLTALENASVQAVLDDYDLIDFVSGLEPQQRYEYGSGYLTNSNADANQYAFFAGGYDPRIVDFAEGNKQPIAPGGLLTGGGASLNAFAGPVLVITGSYDLPFCGGNCYYTGNASIANIPEEVKKGFPKVTLENFAAYIQPNTGHGINLHYNATGAYTVINSFLDAKGLASS